MSPRHLPHKRHPNPRYTPDGIAKFYTDTAASGSAHSSTLSSLSQATSSQGSFSETLGDEGSDLSLQKRRLCNVRSHSFDSNLLDSQRSPKKEEEEEEEEELAECAFLNGEFEEQHSQDTEGTLNPDGSPREDTDGCGEDNGMDLFQSLGQADKRWKELRESQRRTDNGKGEKEEEEEEEADEESDIPLPDDSVRSRVTLFGRQDSSGPPDSHDPNYTEQEEKRLRKDSHGPHVELIIGGNGEPPKLMSQSDTGRRLRGSSSDMGPGIQEIFESSIELSRVNGAEREEEEESSLDSKYLTREESSLDSKYLTRDGSSHGFKSSSVPAGNRPPMDLVHNPMYDTAKSVESILSSFRPNPPGSQSTSSDSTVNGNTAASTSSGVRHTTPQHSGSDDEHRRGRSKTLEEPRYISTPVRKPALRVLRITPSTTFYPASPPEPSNEARYRLVQQLLSPPHDLDYATRQEVQSSRLRMMSPEDSPPLSFLPSLHHQEISEPGFPRRPSKQPRPLPASNQTRVSVGGARDPF